MARDTVLVRCEQCDRDFKTIRESLAFNEKRCNVCAGVPRIVGVTSSLGWPLDTATIPKRQEID